MLYEMEGDITKINAQYIAHQCNCVSRSFAGLAKDIFTKFPWSQTYSKRPQVVAGQRGGQHTPGTIEVYGDGGQQRFVINMYAQVNPGEAKPEILGRLSNDTLQSRHSYFKECLSRISEIPGLKSVAFPYGIGCGLARGKWEDYKKFIEDFSERVGDKINVYIVKYNGPEMDKRPKPWM